MIPSHSVTCPLCGALPDAPCKTEAGGIAKHHHFSRIRAVAERQRGWSREAGVGRDHYLPPGHVVYRVVAERLSPDRKSWWVAVHASAGCDLKRFGVALPVTDAGNEVALRRLVDNEYRRLGGG